MSKPFKRAITFGTFDLFHIGHVRILQRTAELAEEVIVGVSTDELNFSKKQKIPIFPCKDRCKIVSAIQGVTHVFEEESLEKKREYILKYKADVLVMGDDWKGRFDEFSDICKVIYLDRTPSISTTEIKDIIQHL